MSDTDDVMATWAMLEPLSAWLATVRRVALTLVTVAARMVTAASAAYVVAYLLPYLQTASSAQVFPFLVVLFVGHTVWREYRRARRWMAQQPVVSLAPMDRTRPSLRVARHEAAHVLVAHVAGAGVVHAHMHPDGFSEAHVASEVEGGTCDPVRLWQVLLMSVAGNVADLAVGVHDTGSSEDLRMADEYAYALASIGLAPPGFTGPVTSSRLIVAAREEAASILDAHEAALDALTSRLASGARARYERRHLEDLLPDVAEPAA